MKPAQLIPILQAMDPETDITSPHSIQPLAEEVYNLATDLWHHMIPDTGGGHPGIPGPAGPGGPAWDVTTATLQGAIRTLQEILNWKPTDETLPGT